MWHAFDAVLHAAAAAALSSRCTTADGVVLAFSSTTHIHTHTHTHVRTSVVEHGLLTVNKGPDAPHGVSQSEEAALEQTALRAVVVVVVVGAVRNALAYRNQLAAKMHFSLFVLPPSTPRLHCYLSNRFETSRISLQSDDGFTPQTHVHTHMHRLTRTHKYTSIERLLLLLLLLLHELHCCHRGGALYHAVLCFN
uniref:Putative secreted protein n=1 Tax=Anopheles darlingi TaxID=43151 RepID=A0A2M4DFF3_ANODA